MFLILLKASPISANFGQTKHIFCFVFILHTYRTVYVGIRVSNKIKEFCFVSGTSQFLQELHRPVGDGSESQGRILHSNEYFRNVLFSNFSPR
jgi:hypothetical protein